MGQDTKHPAVGGKNPGLSVIFNDVSPSDKKIISSRLQHSYFFCFCRYCYVRNWLYTRLSVQPQAAGRLLNYSQMILEADPGLVGLAEWK